MKQLAAVHSVLASGPVTSRDVADETGLSLKHASAYLRELHGLGLTERKLLPGDGSPGRQSFLYRLKET